MSQSSDAIRTEPDSGATAASRERMAAFDRSQLRATPGYYTRAWRRLRRNKISMISLALVILIVLFALCAELISRYITHVDYQTGELSDHFLPPFSSGHFLGTDGNGRDILTRLAYGGRISLMVAGLATLATLVIGATVGAVSGYFGGFIDFVLMRLVDVLLCIPGLSLLVLVSAVYHPGPFGLAILLAAIGWAGVSRIIRGEVLTLRTRDFVESARVLGASNARIIIKHILPNVIPIIVVWISLVIPGLILTEAALSFLGLGVQVPTPSWGNMLQDARSYYTRSWTAVFIPGFMIYITVLSINLLGKGLRDALDPRLGD